MPKFYAHSGLMKAKPDETWQPLNEHLRQVAALATQFASAATPDNLQLQNLAYIAGLLHDLGKYRTEFQMYIKGLPVQKELTYHKQAGATKAASLKLNPVAFAIAGHHGGIPDISVVQDFVKDETKNRVVPSIWSQASLDCAELNSLPPFIPPLQSPSPSGLDLQTRLLFSCLVDADWTDTSAHENKIKHRPELIAAPTLDPLMRLENVINYINSRASQCPELVIAKVRDDILQACLNQADGPPGLYSLTVPTGGGKTLSGLAFALKHASRHSLRRLIYVAPYLSILDQNARVMRQALGLSDSDPTLFEHHSLAEPPGDEQANDTAKTAAARRAENWESPVILTTSVQFYESLFSNRPARCRKLHNIAGSVIILDECQTLPPDLVAPTCAMLNQLAKEWGCTVVLCTATQPAFDHEDMPYPLESVKEIIPSGLDLFNRLRRVVIQWPIKNQDPINWPTVANKMHEHSAALCIVNSRRAARELFDQIKPLGNAFHLSTSMCPAHRLDVLDTVRSRLANQEPCYLVSTQLVEAGVDIDFPFVMRELAPLEAIIQAAGRCNREGKLSGFDGKPGGRVEVFTSLAAINEPKKYYPPDGWYKMGREILQTCFLNNGREPAIDSREDIQEYFERLYRSGSLDLKDIQLNREKFAFAKVATDYRLIDDSGVGVAVPTWAKKGEHVQQLLDAVCKQPTKSNFRKLSFYQVNMRTDQIAKTSLCMQGPIEGLWIWQGQYSDDIGLMTELNNELLIV